MSNEAPHESHPGRRLHLGRAIRLVWESGRSQALAHGAVLIIQGLLPLLSLYLIKLIVDAITAGIAAPEESESFQRVLPWIGLALGVAVLTGLLRALGRLLHDAQTARVTDHIHDVIHGKSIEVDLEYYESTRFFDTLHRTQEEALYRPAQILLDLVHLVRSGVALLGIAALLASFHVAVLAVIALTAVPGALAQLSYSRRRYDWKHRRTATERKIGYLHSLLTQRAYAKEVRSFGLGQLFRNESRQLRSLIRGEQISITKRRAAAEFLVDLLVALGVFGTLAFMASEALGGAISVGELIMYFGAFQQGQAFLQQLSTAVTRLYESNLFLSNLTAFLDLEPKLSQPRRPQGFPRPIRQGLRFEGVDFRYPGSDRLALQAVSLDVRPGELIALVGENGSGKTTLMKLICRLYDPTRGRITVDGIDLRELEIRELRRQFSVIFQDYLRYDLTARDNIWLGDIELDPEDHRIPEAAARAGVHSVIEGLGRGYETVLGKWLAEGAELSVGEWQKLALARALVRRSQVLILDEPTSSLDPSAEHEFFDNVRRCMGDRTGILFSHRLSTVRLADRIHVIQKGRIIESGTHEELLCLDGPYARMFRSQAESYA